ncbi:hypothetical protein C2S53_012843, partial [Perilla frutescens var. hirtella]
MESINIVLDDLEEPVAQIDEENVDVTIHVPASVPDSSEHNDQTETRNKKLDGYKSSKGVQKHHSAADIIGDVGEEVRMRGVPKNYREMIANVCYTCTTELEN